MCRRTIKADLAKSDTLLDMDNIQFQLSSLPNALHNAYEVQKGRGDGRVGEGKFISVMQSITVGLLPAY